MDDIFKQQEGQDSFLRLQCNEARSCWFENRGDGKFSKHPLPVETQFAPVNSIVCTDIDNDGKMDLLLGGNEYQAEVMTGRYDASYGCYLKGDGKGNFLVIKPALSGFVLKGDIKDMKMINISNNKLILVAAINNDLMKALGLTN
ncbi:MAG: VCBS repeat-containing protein [Ferruginibacter sp.]